MSVFAVVELTVTDPSWMEEYSENVTPMLLQCGGRYVTATDSIDLIEGTDKPQLMGVVEFPSREKAIEFYNSDEYAPYRKARLNGAKCRYLLIDVENGTK